MNTTSRMKMFRIMRRLPMIKHLRVLRVLYTQAELTRLEDEFNSLQNEFNRLKSAGPEVLAEFRNENPHVTSELHIQELITYRASRLKQELGWKEICLARAKRYVE